jgi:hypothetical protein
MDRGLETPAYRVKFGFPSKESGWLHLESDGFISFKYRGDLVFRVPVEEVRASFPKVTFVQLFYPLFDAGIKLVVRGKTYRLLFVHGEYDQDTGVGGGLITWSFSGKDVERGQATAGQWRAAFGQPVNSGH